MTQHKTAQVALQRYSVVSDRCILCKYAKGTHLHFVQCGETDRLYDWLEDFGDLMKVKIRMDVEDRIYATANGGEEMQKGLLFFFTVLFKHMWLGYTTFNKEGITFSPKKVWLAATRRLRIVLHAFEIETVKRFAQIDRLMHPLAGYTAEQVAKAKEKETERRNTKLAPLGSIIDDADGVRMERNFTWKDLARVTEQDE